MQRKYLRLALFTAALITFSGCASPPARPLLPPTNIAEIVSAQFQQSVAAWNVGDLNRFVGIYAESATFAMPDGMLIGREAIREFYAPLFAPGANRDELALEKFDVEVLSPDAVLVRGVYRNSHLGQVVRRGPTTLILRRSWDGWQIVHDHSS